MLAFLEGNLDDAILRYTDLSGANLNRVDLSLAELVGANLRGANLVYADLSGANLRWAKVTDKQLAEAKSLKAQPCRTEKQYTTSGKRSRTKSGSAPPIQRPWVWLGGE